MPKRKSRLSLLSQTCKCRRTNQKRSRRKISKDPNNTKWSRKTDTFGHRILRSQGWEPGQYLGAEDASHAKFHTAANASHIRVALKDDTLGLGAKRNQGDECTGFDVFKDLLGRLNGKSEEVIEKQKKVRQDVRMSLYMERKFGSIRFVSGGFLGGEVRTKLQAAPEDEAAQSQDDTESSPAEAEVKPKKEKKEKRRKADGSNEDSAGVEKKKKRKADGSNGDSAGMEKKKKRKKDRGSKAENAEAWPPGQPSGPQAIAKEGKTKSGKTEKKAKKDKKGKQRATDSSAISEADEATPALPTPKEKDDSRSTEAAVPSVSGRHFARKRFIAQKRLALVDQQALNQVSCLLAPLGLLCHVLTSSQIFMIKA